jgi:DNA repair photolyase
MAGDPRPVLLCFLCDPYQPVDDREQLTRRTLEILGEYRMSAQVLTKGGERAQRDFDLLQRYGFKFGTSLVFTDDRQRRIWEPHAATVQSRMDAIRDAHARGIFTWCSVEPVIEPEQALDVIRELGAAVDFWKVGKLNHMAYARTIDWVAFYDQVTELLQSLRRDYYIKEDLWRVAELTATHARFRSERIDIRLLCPALA